MRGRMDFMGPMTIVFGLLVVVPVVAIFFEHRQKMAEIQANQSRGQDEISKRMENLEKQMDLMNEKLNAIVIATDGGSEVERRLSNRY